MHLASAVLQVVLSGLPLASTADTTRRLMQPEDLFRTEVVGSVAWSPDGDFVALEISGEARWLDMRPTAIWLIDARSGSMRRLSERHAARVRFWNPVWSPDGRRLVFLSVDQQGIVRPWIWTRTQRRATELQNVDVQLSLGNDPPIVWITPSTVAVLAWRPVAQKGQWLQADLLPGHYASELWARARSGREPSATVLESGGRDTLPAPTQLVLIDLAGGGRRVLAEGAIHRLLASPDGRLLSFFRANPGVPTQSVASYLADEQLYTAVNWGTELHVVDVARGFEIATPVDLLDPGYDGRRWSTTGKLVLPGKLRSAGTGSGIVALIGDRIQTLVLPTLDSAAAPTWLGERLVVRGKMRGASRRGWWTLGDEDSATDLTASLSAAPEALHAVSDRALVGIADGEMWRVSPSGPPVNLSAGLSPALSGLRAVDARRGVFYALADRRPAFLHLEGDSVRARFLTPPRSDARLRALSPRGTAAIYFANDSSGSHLWLTRADEVASTELWWGNRWLAAVRRGEQQSFTYTALDGTSQRGWLLLPPHHSGGAKLPLVVVVYPGATWNARSPFDLESINYLDPELFAALGYAVLLPSMPTSASPVADKALDELMNGVMPALDTLVRSGIVDSSRIAVAGLSAGGYATLGLIGRTRRFRAAIAVASYANLVSLYGTFYGQYRDGDAGHPQQAQVLRILQMERGFMALGAPPWRELDRYVRNSPLFEVERVRTPLLLVHGDMDFIPIQQAEEYFTALYRQDKRVRFVRYHGEGHGPTGRANVVHLWGEIGRWLEELMAP